MNKFTTGDGSWQKRLDAGRCPKCEGQIVTQLVPDVKKVCEICKLTVIDSSKSSDKIKDDTMPSEWEADMFETRLMPTEDQIISDQLTKPAIEWSEAITVLESLVRDRLEYMADYPRDYTDDDHVYLEAVWNRILRG